MEVMGERGRDGKECVRIVGSETDVKFLSDMQDKIW